MEKADANLFELLKDFLVEKPISKQALSRLKPGIEISILLAGEQECAYYIMNNQVQVEPRKANNPDVRFEISETGLRHLLRNDGTSLGLFGVEVLRQIVAGEVKVKVVGKVFHVLKNGYLKLIKDAGPEFAQFLTKHGVSSLSKLPKIIKSLKS